MTYNVSMGTLNRTIYYTYLYRMAGLPPPLLDPAVSLSIIDTTCRSNVIWNVDLNVSSFDGRNHQTISATLLFVSKLSVILDVYVSL